MFFTRFLLILIILNTYKNDIFSTRFRFCLEEHMESIPSQKIPEITWGYS